MVDDVVLNINLRLAVSLAGNYIATFKELLWGWCILYFLIFLSCPKEP